MLITLLSVIHWYYKLSKVDNLRARLRSPKTANAHYRFIIGSMFILNQTIQSPPPPRSVVRAFVLEGCELSSFMDRVDNFYQDQE